MTEHAKISVTIKAGSNSGDPWIVFHGDTVDEVGYMIQEVMAKNVTERVRQASHMFATGQTPDGMAVAAIQNAFPGAQVVSAPPADVWAGTDATAQPAQQLPPAASVPCPTCNGPTEFKSGVSKAGKPYKMHKCTSNRDHNPVWA
jgi:hypothetical protein